MVSSSDLRFTTTYYLAFVQFGLDRHRNSEFERGTWIRIGIWDQKLHFTIVFQHGDSNPTLYLLFLLSILAGTELRASKNKKVAGVVSV
jgi:hypothetical protein